MVPPITSETSGSVAPDSSAPPPKPRLHLPYLDGIRALMALYVVHYHIVTHVPWWPSDKTYAFRNFTDLFAYGHYPVVVFIVLSGYCLMLPVLRDGGTLRGGLGTFFQRRARRILPPYYAALVLSALVPVLLYVVAKKPMADVTSPTNWVLHLLLLHDLSPKYVYSLNGALWSIGTEWQIYFFFPLLLLPIWRRFGDKAVIAVGLLVGFALWLAIPSLVYACPWFIGLFAMGMAAANFNFGPHASRFTNTPWAQTGVLLAFATYLLLRLFPALCWHIANKDNFGLYPLPDILLGIATLCLLAHGTRATLEKRPSRMVRICTLKPLVSVGVFSYSLYLVHAPILNTVALVVQKLHVPGMIQYLLLCVSVFPLAIGCSYVFFLLIEKPFMNFRPKEKAVK